MRKKIINIFIIFLLIRSAFFLAQCLQYNGSTMDLVCATSFTENDDWYAAVNADDNIIIVRSTAKGRVRKLNIESGKHFEDECVMLDVLDITQNGEDIFYLTRGYDSNYDPCYKITEMTQSLKVVKDVVTDVFPDGVAPSSLYVDDTNIYITCISADRETCYVYARALDADETDGFSILTQATISDNRFLLQALYNGSTVQAFLDSGRYVYFQNGEAEYMDDADSDLYTRKQLAAQCNVKLGALQVFAVTSRALLVKNLAVSFIIAGILTACYAMYVSRRYKWRQLALYEGGLIALHLVVFFVFMICYKYSALSTYMENVGITMDYLNKDYSTENAYFLDSTDYYATEEYAQAYKALANFSNKSRSVEQLYLVHIDGSNKLVLASLNMDRTTAASYISTDQFLSLAETAKETGREAHMRTIFGGNQCAIFAVPLTDNVSITKYIFAVVRQDAYDHEVVKMRQILSWFNLVTMIICSLIAYGYANTMTKDIRDFSNLMMVTSEDAFMNAKRPKMFTVEMEHMWNALTELLKRFDRLNYAKLLLMEAYYKYTPRKMDVIMQKDSIMEVKVGDVTEINATIATIFLPDKKSLSDEAFTRRANEEFKIMGYHQNAENGIVVSMNNDLSVVKTIFLDDPRDALQFALNTTTDLISYDPAHIPTIFIHSATMLYGILGGEEQAFPYTRCKDMDDLSQIVEGFSKLHGGVFVTDSVNVKMELSNGYRNIGTMPFGEDGRTVTIYQLLDVYSADIRTRYIANYTVFEQALDMFFKKDYYRARSLFSQVLKTNTADEVARWYAFVCEDRMNGSSNSSNSR